MLYFEKGKGTSLIGEGRYNIILVFSITIDLDVCEGRRNCMALPLIHWDRSMFELLTLIQIGQEALLIEKELLDVVFSLGLAMISWQSRKQSNIALSTAEAKYILACFASCEAIWLQKLLIDLFDLEMKATMILCDNQSCIKMIENLVFHDRLKYIEI